MNCQKQTGEQPAPWSEAETGIPGELARWDGKALIRGIGSTSNPCCTFLVL